MDAKMIMAISNQVSRKFPEVRGVKPNVKKRAHSKSVSAVETYLLVFKGEGKNPSGKIIPRSVRVVVNGKGKIIKMTTSK